MEEVKLKPSSPPPPLVNNQNGLNNNVVVQEEGEDEDELCVYTYKGDSRAADLPSSFFEFYHPNNNQNYNQNSINLQQLNTQQINNNINNNNNVSELLYSPDMDFLEMDFDPGITNSSELVNNKDCELVTVKEDSGGGSCTCEQTPTTTKDEEEPCCSKTLLTNPPPPPPPPPPLPPSSVIRLVKSNTLPQIGPMRSAMVVSNSAPTIILDNSTQQLSTKKSIELEVNGAMIWTLEEAKEKSFSQIGTSACGPTAVLNVLLALGIQEKVSRVNELINSRLRDETADLPEYLLSRSNAGTTHEDLINGVKLLTNGQIIGRFFQLTNKTCNTTLIKWLLYWILQGAVPLATLNLQIQQQQQQQQQQQEESSSIPDAWHHQMIFGVTEEGLYLNNPLSLVPFNIILPQLKSPSILLIRRQDVVNRTTQRTDLRKLARINTQWNDMNVLGQVSNMLLEEMPIFNGSSVAKRVRSTHIKIPASYKSGITLFVQTNNYNLCHQLSNNVLL